MERYGGLAYPGERMEQIATGDERGPIWQTVQYPGMTLLDYFAGQALPEVMRQAAADPDDFKGRASNAGLSVFDLIAEHALGQAEAVLDRRKALMGDK